MKCPNEIVQFVPTQYDYKQVKGKCGQTGITGDPVYCDSCNAKHKKSKRKPYECSHGVDMRNEGSMCMRCEFGDE